MEEPELSPVVFDALKRIEDQLRAYHKEGIGNDFSMVVDTFIRLWRADESVDSADIRQYFIGRGRKEYVAREIGAISDTIQDLFARGLLT